MNKEVWKNISAYEGRYQVSDHGRIRSYDKYIKNGKNSERLLKGRILKHGKEKDGYFHVGLFKNNGRKLYKVHRLVLTAFDRPPKPGEQCNHKDGNKQNNHIENLEWCTAKENCVHKNKVLGKSNICNYELTEQDVKEIKVLLKEGRLTQQQIADKYCVKHWVINKIKLSKTWRYV